MIDVRSRVIDHVNSNVTIVNNHSSKNALKPIKNQKIKPNNNNNNNNHDKKNPTVLLIDEVDVFFSESFYGVPYIPSAQVTTPRIKALIRKIWELSLTVTNRVDIDRNQTLTYYENIRQTQEYIVCLADYTHLNDEKMRFGITTTFNIVEEAVKKMLEDVLSYETHEYTTKDGKIQYKVGDKYTDKMIVGYKTLFAAYHECEENELVSEQELEKLMCFNFNCGSFSYAAIPSMYAHVLGVTGTLKHLKKMSYETISILITQL